MKAKGKMIVVSTHDDRYYHLASHCIKLDSGRIVQELSVDSLAGAYYSMKRKSVVVYRDGTSIWMPHAETVGCCQDV